MGKRLLLAFLALLWTNAALAQTFPKPPDVAAFSQVNPLYKTNGTANTVIDSTVTPMPIGTGLTNIPIPSTTNRIVTNGPLNGTANPYILSIPFGGTGQENKFRTLGDFTLMLPDDPIRNYGQPGLSHLHCFFGGGSPNGYSTFKTLRQHALDSSSAGTDINGTAYWFPCVTVLNPYADGKNYAIKPDYIIIYYTENPATDGTGNGAKAFIPIGLRYVLGFDMDATSTTTQYAWLQSVLDAANTAQGYTRYTLTFGGRMQTQASYNCLGATPVTVNVLKNSDGSDPFAGTCASGQQFFIKIEGPACYDGTNLWSPGGYKHFIPGVWDTVVNTWTCPYNYYKLPNLTLEIQFTQNGWTDRQRWDLSSDIAYRAKYSLTTAQLPPGTTFHTDWADGWDDVQRRKWETNCLGVEHNTGHQCDTSQVSSTEYFKGGLVNESGVSRVPQVSVTSIPHVLQTDPAWQLIPPAWSGALVNMHMRH